MSNDTLKYNPNCIDVVEGCWHAVKVGDKLQAWSGIELYKKLVELGRDVPQHFQHYANVTKGDLPPLPDEENEL